MRSGAPRPPAAGSRVKRHAKKSEVRSRLREIRTKRGLSREQLATLAGMHRNSVLALENGTRKTVTDKHADALAAALDVKPTDLGLTIRGTAPGAPRSVRFRRLNPVQRQFIDDLMSLSPEKFEVLRSALRYLIEDTKPKRRRRT